ncbi:MAG: PQQ-dependent sugar dehydrogenase [Gemmatimonadetes bacterium]|nr:PQQ-dependent sugar dehydrogenase [Gemmatimonadota bacterium]|tara:strand:+ start:267 stop:1490 length:1224 start_codon:yes stop_codon:yes gene_type:complete
MKFLLNPLSLWATLVLAACSSIENDTATIIRTAFHDFSVDTVTGGLVHPFSMVFTPEGDLLVTERPGRLRIIRDDVLIDDPVAGLPEILAIGQGAMPQDGREQAGMRDLILHPDFAENRLLYLSYTKPGADSLGNIAVVRGRLEDDRLSDVEEIFHADAFGNGSDRSSQWGGRLALDGKGYLFITIGDRQWPSEGDLSAHPSQSLANHNGTTIRLHEDGRVPEDNPFVGQEGVHPEIWTYGHRNAQGLAIHPETGDVWLNEHGPQGGDELNLIRPGLNYGWPIVGFGVNYRTGIAIHSATLQDGMEPPVHIWVPSIGVTGMLFYTGTAFPDWQGDMIVASLRGEQLVRLTLNEQQVARQETLINGIGRIRDVRQGPNGIIYLAMDGDARGFDGDPTPIVRLIPTGAR